MKRTNAKYKIIKYEIYFTPNKDTCYEIVLGYNETKKEYVTWECANKNDYFWGHYFKNEEQALKDYHQRLVENYNRISCPFNYKV